MKSIMLALSLCVCAAVARGTTAMERRSLSSSESSLRTATSSAHLLTTTSSTTLSPEDEISRREARGTMMDYDHHDEDEEMTEEMREEAKEEPKAVKTDPWAGYYDFLINEGSFKFWAVFQLGTAVLLIYSAFAAVYYAKFNPLTSDYDYYDDFFRRRSAGRGGGGGSWFGLDAPTFQRIIDAVTSEKYS